MIIYPSKNDETVKPPVSFMTLSNGTPSLLSYSLATSKKRKNSDRSESLTKRVIFSNSLELSTNEQNKNIEANHDNFAVSENVEVHSSRKNESELLSANEVLGNVIDTLECDGTQNETL